MGDPVKVKTGLVLALILALVFGPVRRGHGHCLPSFNRRWNAGKELSAAEVAAVVSEIGFEMKTSQICQRRSNDIGVATVCDSEGTDGEYGYLLNVTRPDPNASERCANVAGDGRCSAGLHAGPGRRLP